MWFKVKKFLMHVFVLAVNALIVAAGVFAIKHSADKKTVAQDVADDTTTQAQPISNLENNVQSQQSAPASNETQASNIPSTSVQQPTVAVKPAPVSISAPAPAPVQTQTQTTAKKSSTKTKTS